MVKIAFSSDNHFDINHLEADRMMHQQALFLLEQGVDYYVIAGDLFNDFTHTLTFVRNMQDLLKDKVQIKFIAGNHEMGNGVTYDELESFVDETYLHNKVIDINEHIRLIANNGWYDYSFTGNDYQVADIERFKRAFWYDRRIDQNISDQERFNINFNQMKVALNDAGNRQTVMVTHFVPRADYIVRYPAKNPKLDYANAFMGSPKLGELFDQSYTVATISGHLHLHPAPITVGNNTYYNVGIGYNTARTQEWQYPDFMTEWRNQTKILVF